MFDNEFAAGREPSAALRPARPERTNRPDRPEAEQLREALRSMPPGAELAAVLAGVDVRQLGGLDLVSFLSASSRQATWAQSLQLEAIRELAARRPAPIDPGGPDQKLPAHEVSEFAHLEVAAELAISHRAADHLLGLALDLDRLPATRAALAAGKVSLAKAGVLVDTLLVLDDDALVAAEAKLLARADHWTPSQLRRAATRAAIAADPAAAQARHEQQRAQRRIAVTPVGDGMSELWALLPAPAAEAVFTALTALAEQAKAPHDPRGLDARRADALTDLAHLALERPDLPRRHRHRPHVQVTVAATTLLGLDDNPGELAGHGPIPADLARQIAADATWRRLLTEPVTGALLDYGTTVYEPPAALAAKVVARHRTCRFPGCRLPAERCQLDHVIAFPAGPTSERNLGPLSAHCHRAKHEGGWQVEFDPDTGDYNWTSPAGHTYTTHIDPLLEPEWPDRESPPGESDPPDDCDPLGEHPRGDPFGDGNPPDDGDPPGERPQV